MKNDPREEYEVIYHSVRNGWNFVTTTTKYDVVATVTKEIYPPEGHPRSDTITLTPMEWREIGKRMGWKLED
jgi:hypothetical protein